MNKKIVTLTLLFILSLTVSVYAATLLATKDVTIEVSKETKEQLDKMGLDNSNHSGLKCDEDYCYFDMWKNIDENTTFNLGKGHKIPTKNCTEYSIVDELLELEHVEQICLTYHNYTDLELETLMEEKIVEKLKDYAGEFKTRDDKANVPKTDRVGPGGIKINEVENK